MLVADRTACMCMPFLQLLLLVDSICSCLPGGRVMYYVDCQLWNMQHVVAGGS